MTRWTLRTTLPCLALCLATLTMVGCFGGGVKTYDLTPKQLPHEIAWLKVEEEKQNNRFTGMMLGEEFQEFTNSEIERLSALTDGVSSAMPTDGFNNAVDKCARWLATALPASRAGQGDTKNILIVQDIDNQVDASPELKFAFRNLASKLNSSDVLRGNFLFLSADSQASKDAIALALQDQPGVFDPTGAGTLGQQVSYSPDKIWVIKTSFAVQKSINESNMDVSQAKYSLFVEVENAKGRRNDLAKVFSETFVVHPFKKTWISESENDNLIARYEAAKAQAEAAKGDK